MSQMILYDGIDGESKVKGFEKWIDINHWGWGATAPTSGVAGGGLSAGVATFHEVSVSKNLDVATETLLKKLTSGNHFDKVEIASLKTTGTSAPEEYARVVMHQVYITSITQSAAGESAPGESVSMAFKKFEIKYKPQTEKGALGGDKHFKYDIEAKDEF